MSIEAHVELARRSGCKYPTNINSGGLLSPNLLHSAAKHAQTVVQLASELGIPRLTTLVKEFLFQQLNPDDLRSLRDVPWYERPSCNKITVVNSAVALFYAPSDISGIGGMWREYIRSCPSWQNGPPHYDCAFVNTDPRLKGMRGLDVVRVLGFFSFIFQGKRSISVLHVDTIYRAAHLIPLYGTQFIPRSIKPHLSYDTFTAFYVNKFIDHHAFALLLDT